MTIVAMQKGEPMSDCMTFPDTVEEFMELYKITDTDYVYTNGIEMVPIFRMRQWFEHVSAQPKINNQINLCDTCRHTYPDCPAGKDDVLYGNGAGNDNICACSKYEISGQTESDWIPCSKRVPDDLAEVNITYLNTRPEPYYDFLKGKPFAGTAVYYKGRWYWYSAVCVDYLGEYGFSPNDEMDDYIKVIAWKPLPEPYIGE